MKIKSVAIKNFRALQDVSVQFDSVTTFIGPNGVGKSSVLLALDWFFNGKPNSLSDADCSLGQTDQRIEVRVTFSDLTKRDRNELGKYAPDDVTVFTAWKTRLPDGTETLSANAKSFSKFNEIKKSTNATNKKELYAALRSDQPELELPAATTGTAVDEALRLWEAEHIDHLEEAPEILVTNFFGFNSGGKMSGLFDFVLVSADLRASEESIDGKSSIIGKILERTIDRSIADEEIDAIVQDSRLQQQRIYKEKFQDSLNEINRNINTIVNSYAPGRSIKVTPADVILKPPRTTFEVTVLDGKSETSVDRQGHGFQRTLLISALQQLAQTSTSNENGVICLAIEEPELYQHPIQAQAFAKILRTLANSEAQNMQVMYATHSPYFLEARYFHQIRRLTRSPESNAEVSIHFTTLDDVKNKLSEIVKASTIEKQIDGIITNNLAIAMFSNRAVIVEGTTDAAILSGASDNESLGKIEALGVAVVPIGSKTAVPTAHAVLSLFGIPAYALVDADSDFKNRNLNKTPEKLEDEKKSHISANRAILKYFGVPEVDFPKQCATKDFAFFGDCLETFIIENWPEWETARSDLEKELNSALFKNQNLYRLVTANTKGNIPDFLKDILKLARGESIAP